jgi:hypothetical protein
MEPIVVLYVLLVFVAFMLLAGFVFHSMEAVKALFFTAIGSLVAMVPSLQARIEYRMTEDGVSKRPYRPNNPADFKDVFSWDELSRLVPTRRGFKFYKQTGTTGPLRRFFKLHLLGGFSGEVHVEARNMNRVQEFMERQGSRVPDPL